MSPDGAHAVEDAEARAAVAAGLQALGVAASMAQIEQLTRYAGLVGQWNRTFNLVSRRDMARFLPRHLLDSLTALPWLLPDRCVDLGSGAGLPGIPLAILQPQISVTLLERSGKKARFLTRCLRELALENLAVRGEDASSYAPAAPYHTLVSRAVAPPARLWALGHHLLAPGGRMVLHAAVGENGADLEMPEGIPAQFHEVAVPGLAEPHQLLLLEQPPA